MLLLFCFFEGVETNSYCILMDGCMTSFFFCLQATAVYDTEHAENIQKGQHIQPSANGYLFAPGIAPGKLISAV